MYALMNKMHREKKPDRHYLDNKDFSLVKH